MKTFIESLKIIVIPFIIYCCYLVVDNEITRSKSSITYEVKDKYKKEKICLQEVLWYEARNTSVKEQHSIIDVVMNRTRSGKYPNNICDVIKQDWQFEYRNKLKDKTQIILPQIQDIAGKPDRIAYGKIAILVESRFDANGIRENVVLPSGVMHYHTKNIKNKPKWSKSKEYKIVPLDSNLKHRYYLTLGSRSNYVKQL